VHEAVRSFYKQHYSANLMRLVVVGRQPLDELERLVRDKFSVVPDRQLSALRPPGKPPLRPSSSISTSCTSLSGIMLTGTEGGSLAISPCTCLPPHS